MKRPIPNPLEVELQAKTSGGLGRQHFRYSSSFVFFIFAEGIDTRYKLTTKMMAMASSNTDGIEILRMSSIITVFIWRTCVMRGDVFASASGPNLQRMLLICAFPA